MGLEIMTNFIGVIAVVDTVRSSYCSSHHDSLEAMDNCWIEICREYQFQRTILDRRYQMSLRIDALSVAVLWHRPRLLASIDFCRSVSHRLSNSDHFQVPE